jgi:hypothetical protein
MIMLAVVFWVLSGAWWLLAHLASGMSDAPGVTVSPWPVSGPLAALGAFFLILYFVG